jgi:CBS domain-containing protein
MNVSEIMTRSVVSVTPETTLKEVAALLTERRIAGVPVCRSDGELVGVISEGDILWKETGLAPASETLLTRILNAADREDDKLAARTAGEAMSSPAITVAANAAAAQAARLMIDHHVNRLPVLADGKLVGIIARSDLVRAFVRSDAEIAREIEQDVLLRVLWIEPRTLSVSVEAGEVRLTGRVDNRSTAELVETYVRRIPGVVALSGELSWNFDDLARRVAAAAKVIPHKL